ncbi:hypothetical protein TNCV_3337591 [Trichonephila clavipes]|nr:hypothetical protein TNCV_3337591 [Trichonephila clavipes]
MSDMETEHCDLNHLRIHLTSLPELTKPGTFQSLKGNDKSRKQKDPKRKAIEPPPEETDNDKCRRHKEIQKRIKMMNGRLSFLEHCIQSEKGNFLTSPMMTPSLDFKRNMMNSLPRRSKTWVS